MTRCAFFIGSYLIAQNETHQKQEHLADFGGRTADHVIIAQAATQISMSAWDAVLCEKHFLGPPGRLLGMDPLEKVGEYICRRHSTDGDSGG